MANVKDYGELFTADILIVGGGMAGLVTAIRAKENKPNLDILVIDKGIIGWNGQATKAGNGIRSTSKHPDGVKNALNYLVHAHTPFINDQEMLRDYLVYHKDSIDYMKHCGVITSCNEDGEATPLPFIPNALDMGGVSINICAQLRAHALKLGIRLLNRVNVFELLTNDAGKTIGAIGFDMDHMECKIFHAKAVVLATQGCHFKKIGLEFMGYGTGVGAAYRVGAQVANVEFSTQVDVVFKKTNTPIYGGFNMICNKNGLNLTDHYIGHKEWEVTPALVQAMVKEVAEGNGPLTVDLEHPDEVREMIGGTDMHESTQRMFRDKMHWEHLVFTKTAKNIGDVGSVPETTIKTVIQLEPMKVDNQMRTNVEGLWATGKMVTQGCAYFGWTRGDGLGFASTTGMMAGDSVAPYAANASWDELNLDQIAALKEKIYAPLSRPNGRSPKEIFDMIETYIFDVKYAIIKDQSTFEKVFADIKQMKAIVPELGATDPHGLAKCLEAADNILALEMIFRTAEMRKETRGIMYPHYRADYPETDNKNWLKWINIKQGADGEMELWTEDIPMWKYPVRPVGYEIPEGHVDEYDEATFFANC
ncbi:MAG: FAD-dependent oxidoreductase [Eubacterium sp.]|nr:FAD-dependent oxidoreductase [Eubacterium sp.]